MNWYRKAQEEGDDDLLADAVDNILEDSRKESMGKWRPVPPEVMRGVRPDMRGVHIEARVINGRGQFRHGTTEGEGRWWVSETFPNDFRGWTTTWARICKCRLENRSACSANG